MPPGAQPAAKGLFGSNGLSFRILVHEMHNWRGSAGARHGFARVTGRPEATVRRDPDCFNVSESEVTERALTQEGLTSHSLLVRRSIIAHSSRDTQHTRDLFSSHSSDKPGDRHVVRQDQRVMLLRAGSCLPQVHRRLLLHLRPV